METSDVRSIDALRQLKAACRGLSQDWDGALQQIKFCTTRIEEHFASTLPAYWREQTRAAERRLSESLDNLSRLQGNVTDGNAPAMTEAKQRVQLARRRLALCESKSRAAKTIAIEINRVCQELAGPLAQVCGHVEVTLPGAASVLGQWIGHLEAYADTAADRPTRNPNREST